MRFFPAALVLIVGAGCVTRDPKVVKTQVVTFPDGALVEFNGAPAGRAPAAIVLPQDADGRLTERAMVRAVPNSNQAELCAQTRVFEPGERVARVPNQIMIDMRERGTNMLEETSPTTHVEHETRSSSRSKIPYTERSKPTQAVGLDRWNPGKY